MQHDRHPGTRQRVISRSLALAAILALPAPSVSLHAAEARTSAKPNILILLADDMNWHYPGFNGGPVSTPTLDRLAREGTTFKQFYVHAVCSPTRAALLTGRYPFRNGMEERSHGNDTAGLLPDERTLAQALQDTGYDTWLLGKWHLGNWYQRQLPLQRGFDHHYGFYGALISYYDKVRNLYYDWHRNGETVHDDGYTTDLFAREFERVMGARKGNAPFFSYVAFNAIHGPNEAPPELVAKYRKRLEAEPGNTRPNQHEYLAVKYAMLEAMDTAIGRMLAALDSHDARQNTLIVFFNDNGGRKENLPFRGGKGDTYEGGVRVPCVFNWPGRVPGGQSVTGMVHVVDLYPTLIQLAGGSLEQRLPLDGVDVWDMITRGARSPRREVVHSLPGQDVETGAMSVRQDAWKMVGKELYNLETDPGETTDVAAQHPDVYERLRQRIEHLLTERRPPETHARIPARPLLVFGEKENAHPPPWLPGYLDKLKAAGKGKKKRNQSADADTD